MNTQIIDWCHLLPCQFDALSLMGNFLASSLSRFLSGSLLGAGLLCWGGMGWVGNISMNNFSVCNFLVGNSFLSSFLYWLFLWNSLWSNYFLGWSFSNWFLSCGFCSGYKNIKTRLFNIKRMRKISSIITNRP